MRKRRSSSDNSKSAQENEGELTPEQEQRMQQALLNIRREIYEEYRSGIAIELARLACRERGPGRCPWAACRRNRVCQRLGWQWQETTEAALAYGQPLVATSRRGTSAALFLRAIADALGFDDDSETYREQTQR